MVEPPADLITFEHRGERYFYSARNHRLSGDPDLARRPAEPEPRPPGEVRITSIWLNLTDACNLACRYCFTPPVNCAAAARKPRFMTAETARSAVMLLGRLWQLHRATPAAQIVFFGGEPLLNEAVLEETVHFAREWGRLTRTPFRFLLSTNGTILERRHRELFEREELTVQVSIDGPPAAHDRHRTTASGRGSFAAIDANRRMFQDLPPPGPSIRATIAEGALPISETVRFFRRQGYRNIGLKFLADNNRSGAGLSEADFQTLEGDVDRAVEEVALARANGASIDPFEEHLRSLGSGRSRQFICSAGKGAISIDAGGGIYPCHRFHDDEEYRIGHVDEPWDDEVCRRFTDLAADEISPCRGCWAVRFCWGCCPAESVAFGKELGQPHEQWCRMKRLEATISLKLAADCGEAVIS